MIDRLRKVVCLPTYDERDALPGVLRRLRSSAPDCDVLVIDDNSPDGTGRLADELAATDPRIHVLHRATKEGFGRAYLAGFDWGLSHGYDVLVQMDADGSHQPEQLGRLLSALDRSDVAVGSRYVPGGRLEGWPWPRELLSRGGNQYVRLALHLPLRDATGGYRAYRATALRRILAPAVESQGYCFQVDLALRAVHAGLLVEEVPITFVERTVGVSKMNGRIVAEALARVTGWALRRAWVGQPAPRNQTPSPRAPEPAATRPAPAPTPAPAAVPANPSPSPNPSPIPRSPTPAPDAAPAVSADGRPGA